MAVNKSRLASWLGTNQRRQKRQSHRGWSGVLLGWVSGSLLASMNQPAVAQTNAYCQLSAEEITQTSAVHQLALQGDQAAQQRYQTLVRQHAEQLQRCRSQTWPQKQAIWLRLYPCDAVDGVLEEVMDRIVSRGYNEVFLEVFYNGQVLLPAAQNSTRWPSVLRTPGYETRDLLAEAVRLGRERGLKVYAWMFTLNFGYSYSQSLETQSVLARNGQGATSLTSRAPEADGTTVNADELFIDPYHPQAKQDYAQLLQAILQRQPDGVLFDYIRYPKGTGSASVASRVQDLWIYGTAAQQALYQRALNQKGMELIQRFLTKGHVNSTDWSDLAARYPTEPIPLWQGLTPVNDAPISHWQNELWRLTVAHAIQGVLDFLAMATASVQQRGLKAGAVFFPEANQTVGQQGYDSRLQAWERFPHTIDWHPMAYATCADASCIVAQIQRVAAQAPSGTQIQPALAGSWGQTLNQHPPLEQQMQAIRQAFPQLQAVSHFAFSWQEPAFDHNRKFCQLR
ncbi:family 10 glycosylhydrolase [Leptolyngbya sp. NK1-12]|uniref:Family 10 glycosylhydrolase n=1 Tax=Leptolyngbya sp. NK1-12 TaxID=2547451 RepID=A0AA96WGP5_9CYAN|nr:family 10 glycosylhydrolase [Leptolyngbya sp. NK1-12]